MNQTEKNLFISKSLRDNDYLGYKKIKLIGCGAFGCVYQCKNNITEDEFAMKKILIKDGKYEQDVIKEVLVLASLEPHDRLVQFFGSKRKDSSLQIFLEYMPMGSLQDYLKSHGSLSEIEASQFTKQILEGIEYLHNVNIIHRDIKPANILMANNNGVKLTDFGVSKIVENLSALNVQTCCGTIKYMAPELLSNLKYNNSIDIWSLGVTLIEMVNGELAFSDLTLPQLLYKMSQPNFKFDFKKDPSKELSYFIKLTFIKTAEKRPTASDMKYTKFISRIDVSS